MGIRKTEVKKNPVLPLLKQLGRNFFEHSIGRNAAALAYYLLFAMFPFLIFLSNFLGLLELNITEVTQSLQRFLPGDIVQLIEYYYNHVSHSSSHTLLGFALVFTIWFPMRAVKGLMDAVRQAYHLDKPTRPIRYIRNQFMYTVVFLVVIVATLLLSTFGKYVLSVLTSFLPYGFLPISHLLLEIWQYLRFGFIGILMYAALGSLYVIALDERPKMRTIRSGIIAALVFWMMVSVGFSFYVENIAHYSVIYGTLGAVIVLLVWLYLTAVILIMGAELNAELVAKE